MSDIKRDTLQKVIKNYETIPRKISKNTELQAIYNIRELINFMEKDVQGELNDFDMKKINENKHEWLESANMLREYFENKEA